VCEGQIVETGSVNDPERTPDQYLNTIRLKTAALFAAACELGAATSGADPLRRAALLTYGESLGLAFQVIDDLLDLIGDPRITGKEPGTDLREGVFTIPVLIACERDPSLSRRLASGDRELSSVLPALEASGALEAALALARAHGERAESSLEGLPEEEWTGALRTIITGVLAQVPDASPV
jgi:geranylgeranyl pyrophosphate synthase